MSEPIVMASACRASSLGNSISGKASRMAWIAAAASDEPPPSPAPVGMRLRRVSAMGSGWATAASRARWARTHKSLSSGQLTVS